MSKYNFGESLAIKNGVQDRLGSSILKFTDNLFDLAEGKKHITRGSKALKSHSKTLQEVKRFFSIRQVILIAILLLSSFLIRNYEIGVVSVFVGFSLLILLELRYTKNRMSFKIQNIPSLNEEEIGKYSNRLNIYRRLQITTIFGLIVVLSFSSWISFDSKEKLKMSIIANRDSLLISRNRAMFLDSAYYNSIQQADRAIDSLTSGFESESQNYKSLLNQSILRIDKMNRALDQASTLTSSQQISIADLERKLSNAEELNKSLDERIMSSITIGDSLKAQLREAQYSKDTLRRDLLDEQKRRIFLEDELEDALESNRISINEIDSMKKHLITGYMWIADFFNKSDSTVYTIKNIDNTYINSVDISQNKKFRLIQKGATISLRQSLPNHKNYTNQDIRNIPLSGIIKDNDIIKIVRIIQPYYVTKDTNKEQIWAEVHVFR